MKKIILITAVILVALVGLTSYNGKEEHKEKGNSSLIASLGEPTKGTTTSTTTTTTTDKKTD